MAKERGAGVMGFGDIFCAMQGKYDNRADKRDLRPEHQNGNYFDNLVDTATDWWRPYADIIIALTDGNHETEIRKRHETDLLERLAVNLGVAHMGYSGFVRFMFEHASGGHRTTRRLYWHHGAGGGGPVTKGVIQTNRRAASVDADIFVSGHIHESWIVENVMVSMTDSGRIVHKPQVHCQTATYKQEYVLEGGYHTEKGRPPKPLGGWWLVFHYDSDKPGSVGFRFERAD
jgi:hypothetical protein